MGTDFFKPAAAGFESPLELLLACHERIRRFAGLLVRLGPHLALHGSDAQAQEAARSVLRYFDVAAPLHHQDEDDDLFPALQRRGDAALRSVLVMLALEHDALSIGWQQLRPCVMAVAAGDPAVWPDGQAAAFARCYCRHVDQEETSVYPLAPLLLDQATLDVLGACMARRRHG
ncbi:hemerythrin domain-containing protein [Andreprevotia sp. IGB-42]|uniref:hemerythrin domain-containing protein n=1 Tax=Andreprevotia sp. IGB-42 TaxID=2497473 RepID=UPI0013574593|nr:hemerythrin domain-containing protein [Andreprevotia sp. IGB-42]